MMSKGEEKVVEILTKHKIPFEREYSFPGLVGYKQVPLRFDFVIFNNKHQILACIDFDGKQHYEFVKFFHKTQSGFKKQQEWDRRKNKYCLMHNIPLYRIPYWQLEDLTFEKIFSPINRVTNKYHIDNIKRSGVKM